MTVTQSDIQLGKSSATRVRELDITILAGGPSVEREVSLHSGEAIHAAMTRLGHHSVVCDVGPDDLTALDRPTDLVFIALHGEFGEDGTIQAELDARRIPYSGSDAAASRTAMDKVESKRRFQRAGIATPDFEVINRENAEAALARFPLPAVIKPVASGSSVDTHIVRTSDALRAASNDLLNKYGEALLERLVEGPELTVGILGGDALPVCEIRTEREFYDYEAKYVDDHTEYRFDLDLPASLIERVKTMSLAAHNALGCSVFSRVDWMIDASTLEPLALEVNTIPGFTGHSLLPKAAARIGMNFEELCQRIIDLSLQR